MNFSDIFKKTFLEGFASTDISTQYIIVALLITAAISLYIFFIYRIVTKKTFYSLTFNISLVATAIITAAIIFTIQSNVVISLGMVGALSIVRFRTAIKDPMDLVFLFWSISVGIICGAGFSGIAVVTSLILTAAIFLLAKFPVVNAPMILVVNATAPETEEAVLYAVSKHCRHYKVKSRNIAASRLDMVIEVRIKEEAALVREVSKIEGVASAALLSHDGQVTY
jgi:uncharacterized membrane protein YhiD involved in acid resistance